MADRETGAASVWQPKSQQNAKALRLFRDGMDDIHQSLRLLRGGHVGSIGTIGRRVSVELRKLLFDATPLVHRVLHRPRFHAPRDKAALTAIQSGIDRALAKRTVPPEDIGSRMKWEEPERTSDKARNRRRDDAEICLDDNVQAAYAAEDWQRILDLVDRYVADGWVETVSKWRRD